MRKIILDLAVTLDGFIEGPNGEIDWCMLDDDGDFENSEFGRFLESIDTVFYGRISYELWGEYRPDESAGAAFKAVFEAVHSKKKFVFSRSTSPGARGKINYISDDVVNTVRKIKEEPGRDIWLYGGSKLITSFINAGLVDTYRLAVHPIILGSGKPLFHEIEQRQPLRLVNSTSYPSGIVVLIYESIQSPY